MRTKRAGSRGELAAQLAQPSVAHGGLGALDCLVKPLIGERFQEVVEGVHVEGVQGVPIERGHEDDRRHVLRTDGAHDAEPVQLGHLDVEEDQIDPVLFERVDRLAAVARFPDNDDVGIVLQQPANAVPGGRLVVYDQHPNPLHALPHSRVIVAVAWR